MMFPAAVSQVSLDLLVEDFFRQSEGEWRSERRYFTLKNGQVQEGVSRITVEFLAPGSPKLVHLARLHQLPDDFAFTCGAQSLGRVTIPSQRITNKPVQLYLGQQAIFSTAIAALPP